MIKSPDEKQKMIDWLKHQIGEFENISDDLPFGLEEDEEMHLKVMRFALGSLNATAQPVSGWLIPVPDEFLYADQNEKGLFELSEDCMCRLSVALSQQSKGLVVKPGYALLPIEPTEEMLAAGSATDGGLYCIWKDMLAAAPGGQDS